WRCRVSPHRRSRCVLLVSRRSRRGGREPPAIAMRRRRRVSPHALVGPKQRSTHRDTGYACLRPWSTLLRHRLCSSKCVMRRLTGIALATSVFACAATELPEPALVSQTTASLVEVAFPPPPARVEVVPAQP